ncbi:MAG: sorbosone dehydrogenase [Planctomycetota bacterium]|nr:MAG: sorbosone dehydrogenase [Planctomycetota bacterium]
MTVPLAKPIGVRSKLDSRFRGAIPCGWLVTAILIVLSGSLAAAQPAASQLQLRDGDRVVWIGDGLIEQEQYCGWWEVMLASAYPDADVTFRNLGWSADTPAGASRCGLSLVQAGYEPPDEGWKQLQSQLELTRPTILIVGYGMASMLEGGAAGVERFRQDLQRLARRAQEISPPVRFVFLTPLCPLGHDDDLCQSYAQAVREVAVTCGAPLVDLTTAATDSSLRKDPIHLNDAGYRATAIDIQQQLGLPDSGWRDSPHTEPLRQAILRKNTWWFHRSRPANMAYVFGFRKREQGQNAVEIPQFDALVAAEEKLIARLRHLAPADVQPPAYRRESQFAKFAEQPLPDFTIDDRFRVTLWAQNPLLNKPIHMNFDPAGRLWIASSQAYPMIEVGQVAPDKVVVLEDADGDGRADKSSVFAEGLLIPTGIAPGDGGVYVAQSTDLLHLRDIDGDGRADQLQRVLSGFGTEDTHHNLHTLRWGPDGRLYMNQSVYTRTDTETPHGIVRLRGGGGFRYDTRHMQMQIFFRGLWNSWGHQFDRFGQSFLTDGAGFDGVAYTFPGAVFRPTPGARQQLGLISPGKWPKFASLEIIHGDSFPPDWQGNIITCDFRANRVVRFRVAEQGAGFVTEQMPDVLRTSQPTFRPIDVKQGPDGALYIADWSNPIINHGEVDFRDPRRDRWHGRIWKVEWKEKPTRSPRNLFELSNAELLDETVAADRYRREQARAVLRERGASILTDLADWVERHQQDPEAALAGLWVHQSLDVPNIPLLQRVLSAQDHRIRAAGVRVLSAWSDPQTASGPSIDSATAMESYQRLIADAHPRVRLEAVRGLGRLPTAAAGELALSVLDGPMDRFLEHALWLTVNELADPLVEAIESSPELVERLGPARLQFVMTAIDPQRAAAYVAQRLATTPIRPDGEGPWIELIGQVGGPAEIAQLFALATSGELQPAATARALRALVDAQRLRKVAPKNRAALLPLLDHAAPEVRRAAVELAAAWKMAAAAPQLFSLARQAGSGSGERTDPELARACVDALRSLGSSGREALSSLAGSADLAWSLRAQAVGALAGVDPQAAIAAFATLVKQADKEADAAEAWRQLLANRDAGKHLAGQLEQLRLPLVALRGGRMALRDGGREEPELQAALSRLLAGEDAAEWSAERIAAIVQAALEGDPDRGQRIYRRDELACTKCHAIGGVGGQVGPDLSSIGASAPIDYIAESLFAPNAKIKEGFHSVTVVTEDDRILTGIEVENNPQELVLRDAEDRLVRIPQTEVVAKKAGQSLMPVGAIDRLTPDEQADLIAFLSRLGRPGRFDSSRRNVARVFDLLAGTHRLEQQGADRIIRGEHAQGWQRVATLVDGTLPRDEIERRTVQPVNIALVTVYLRTVFQWPGGPAGTLTVSGPRQAELWIDGQPAERLPASTEGHVQFAIDAAAGRHTLLLRLDARELPDSLKVESSSGAFVGQ